MSANASSLMPALPFFFASFGKSSLRMGASFLITSASNATHLSYCAGVISTAMPQAVPSWFPSDVFAGPAAKGERQKLGSASIAISRRPPL